MTTEPTGPALAEALAAMLAVDDLRAGTTAMALAGRVGQQHVLRFTATDAEGRLIGGYTVVLA